MLSLALLFRPKESLTCKIFISERQCDLILPYLLVTWKSHVLYSITLVS